VHQTSGHHDFIERIQTFFQASMEIEPLRDIVRKLVQTLVSRRKAELGRTFELREEDNTRSQGGVDDRPRKRPRGLIVKGARY
jgi:hypothetical protein